MGIVEQIIKVHGIRHAASRHVAGIDIPHQGDVFGLVGQKGLPVGGIGIRRDQPVLGPRDTGKHHPRLIDLLIQLHLLEDRAHQALAVGRVIYGKMGRESNPLSLRMEDAQKDGMERAHPEFASLLHPHLPGDAFLHLPGRLVGKGEGQHAPRLEPRLQQIGHLVGKHTGLPRPCTCYHKRGSIVVEHSRLLALVQFIQSHISIMNSLKRKRTVRPDIAARQRKQYTLCTLSQTKTCANIVLIYKITA